MASRTHPALAIDVVMKAGRLLRIGARGGGTGPGDITASIMPPGDAIKVVVLIHRGGWVPAKTVGLFGWSSPRLGGRSEPHTMQGRKQYTGTRLRQTRDEQPESSKRAGDKRGADCGGSSGAEQAINAVGEAIGVIVPRLTKPTSVSLLFYRFIPNCLLFYCLPFTASELSPEKWPSVRMHFYFLAPIRHTAIYTPMRASIPKSSRYVNDITSKRPLNRQTGKKNPIKSKKRESLI